MKEILYLEVPTPNTHVVRTWLQQDWQPERGQKIITKDSIRLQLSATPERELSLVVWSLQRTTYLKVFCWGKPTKAEHQICRQLYKNIRTRFPQQYPVPPKIDLSNQSIFDALADYYPQTVHFFQKFPNGEYDLNRVYWWEQRWRESVCNPKTP